MPGSVITFDPAQLSVRRAELESAMSEPGFWDDQARAQKISTEHARVSEKIGTYERLTREYEDARDLYELDPAMEDEIASSVGPQARA